MAKTLLTKEELSDSFSLESKVSTQNRGAPTMKLIIGLILVITIFAVVIVLKTRKKSIKTTIGPLDSNQLVSWVRNNLHGGGMITDVETAIIHLQVIRATVVKSSDKYLITLP